MDDSADLLRVAGLPDRILAIVVVVACLGRVQMVVMARLVGVTPDYFAIIEMVSCTLKVVEAGRHRYHRERRMVSGALFKTNLMSILAINYSKQKISLFFANGSRWIYQQLIFVSSLLIQFSGTSTVFFFDTEKFEYRFLPTIIQVHSTNH